MATLRSTSSIWLKTGLVISMLILGSPLAIFFTHGAILIPLLIVMVLGPLGMVHYLVWGWWLSPGKDEAGERKELGINRVEVPSISNPERIASKEQRYGFFRR